MQISKSRWGVLVSEVKNTLLTDIMLECSSCGMSESELELIISVLKNNTPFEVVDEEA